MKYLLCAASVLFYVFAATATVIHIPDDYQTIQEGIDAASAGDTVLLADGIYTGEGNIDLDFGGVDIVLKSENGPENCIIDCQSMGQGLYFHSGETQQSVVEGIFIVNGYAMDGGGVLIEFASPTFKNCIIADCYAYSSGGGFSIIGMSPQIINCTIHNNFSATGGGLKVSISDLVMNSCIIAANSSSG